MQGLHYFGALSANLIRFSNSGAQINFGFCVAEHQLLSPRFSIAQSFCPAVYILGHNRYSLVLGRRARGTLVGVLVGGDGDPAIAGLEVEGWSFARLRRSATLGTIAACARQSMVVAASWHDQAPPVARLFIRPLVLRAVLRVAPWVMPFDLETYLDYHFTKVGDQTRHHLETLAEVGQERGLPVHAIAGLRTALS